MTSIADFRGEAEALGYKVLVAEGSPIVLKIIVSGYVDAIVGVACLNVLEKAIDKILLAGIPCMAVPLLSSDCRNTSVDEEWVTELIRLQLQAPVVQTRTYVHLMRAAAGMFAPEELTRLAPPLRRTKPADGNGWRVCSHVWISWPAKLKVSQPSSAQRADTSGDVVWNGAARS